MHSVSILRPKQWKKTSTVSSQNQLSYGTYPPIGSLENAYLSDNVIWNSVNNTLRSAIARTETRPFSHSQEPDCSDDIPSPLCTDIIYGSRNVPSDVLPAEHFFIPGYGVGPSHAMSQPVIPLDPWDYLNPGLSCTAESYFCHPQMSDHNPSNCATPSTEDDVSLDFDFDLASNSDIQTMPTDVTGLPQYPLTTAVDLAEQIYGANRGSQGYYPDILGPPNVGNNDFTAQALSGCTQYKPIVDGYFVPQDAQELPPPSVQFDQREFSPVTDTGSWTCEIPECGKTFQKRHKFNKHRQSHSRILRCSFPNCKRRAYQEKDIRAHIAAVHNKAKFPCPFEGCPYSRTGPKRGISRKDALMRHLRSHETRRSRLQNTVTK